MLLLKSGFESQALRRQDSNMGIKSLVESNKSNYNIADHCKTSRERHELPRRFICPNEKYDVVECKDLLFLLSN